MHRQPSYVTTKNRGLLYVFSGSWGAFPPEQDHFASFCTIVGLMQTQKQRKNAQSHEGADYLQ
jgi:hypothetical protein